MSHGNGYLHNTIVAVAWSGSEGTWEMYPTDFWMSTMKRQHILSYGKRTENKSSSSCADVSEVAWAGRQVLYHAISSEINAAKIPSSHNFW